MSTFVIKIIAMVTMFCDHLSRAIYGRGQTTFLNYIGRFAFLLFCFQLVLGYKKTKSLKKYLLRLLIIGIISQIPYSLFFETVGCNKNLNVIFTLLIGLLSISIINFHKDKNGKITFRDNDYNIFEFKSFKSVFSFVFKGLLIFIICLTISNSKKIIGYGIEYNYQAILFMIGIYLFYPFDIKYNIIKIILYVLNIELFAFVEAQSWYGIYNFRLPFFNTSKDIMIYFSIYLFCIIGGLIPLLYNGKKGKSIKWLTYLFYPVHLLILHVFYLMIN